MIIFIKIYQICILLFIIIKLVNDFKKSKIENDYKTLSISKWVFYFPAFFSLGFSMTILTSIIEKDVEGYAVSKILGIACIISLWLMILQNNWKIQYSDEVLIFRNFFLKTKVYKRSDINLKFKKNIVVICEKDKKITDYSYLIVPIKEDLEFIKFI